jgi:hypothetical protein
VDLVVSQNGAPTKLLRNQGARPGLRVRLVGRPENPEAIGAVLRLKTASGLGPAMELHSGSGYWSQDGLQAVMTSGETGLTLVVRWPGGRVSEVPIAPGVAEVTVPIP